MRLIVPLLLLLSVAPTRAQPAGIPPPDSLTSDATASVLTMLPGDEVYSLFGHSAIRIRDERTGLDRSYNYGTFSFDQPFFVVRFLRGNLDYLLDYAPFEDELFKYQFLERPMIEQTLDLSPTGVQALYDFLENNALPENRAYRYDFFWDNCSTRIVGAIDSALVATGLPASVLPASATNETFRQLLAPYLVGQPLVDVGLNLALGSPGDRVATATEETFLPLRLAAQLDRATVAGKPLVSRRDTLFWVQGAEAPERAVAWPMWLMWLVAGWGLALTVRKARQSDAKTLVRFDRVLLAVTGVAGVIVALLWFGTSHDVMGPNWNLIWAWPTHLGAAFTLRRGTFQPFLRVYLLLAALVTGLGTVLWFFLPQVLPLAILPLAVLLTVRLLDRARRVANPTESLSESI